LSLPPEGGGIIRSKIFRALRFGKSRLIKALVKLSKSGRSIISIANHQNISFTMIVDLSVELFTGKVATCKRIGIRTTKQVDKKTSFD
jgi:hypothetical protein